MEWTQETWVQSLGQKDPLEEGVTTHSSILAWEIPWTEKPDRLYSPWGLRVRHNWAHTHTQPIDCTTPSVNPNGNYGLWMIIMHQWHSTLVGDTGNGAGHVCLRARDILELSVPSSQLCCESKTDLKQLSLKKKRTQIFLNSPHRIPFLSLVIKFLLNVYHVSGYIRSSKETTVGRIDLTLTELTV